MLTETLFKVIKRRSYVLGLWSKLIVAPAVSREIQNYLCTAIIMQFRQFKLVFTSAK